MLQQLDVLIGFAVVMSVVSLLITIMTQMMSALLGLRGANLADALVALILKIDPNFDQGFPGLSKNLADEILTHPMTSDSAFSMTKDRGKLERLFKTWKRASAIRPEEFLEVARHLAGVKDGQMISEDALNQARSLTAPATAAAEGAMAAVSATSGGAKRAAVIDAKDKSKAAQKVHAAFAAAKLLFALQQHQDETPEIRHLETSLPGFAGPVLEQNKARLDQLKKEVTATISDNVEQWFNAAQDRAQQWFATHTRVWTVVFAFVMAFLLQLDTINLFTRLSTDSELRGKLVNYSQPALEKKADEVFSNTLSMAAMNREALHWLQTSNDVPDDVRTKVVPPELRFDVTADVEKWLADGAGSNAARVVQEFREFQQQVARRNYDGASKDFAELSDSVSKTGFLLMPDPYPPIFARPLKLWSWPWHWMSGQWSWGPRRLLGILASVALLSLGAPFWFNALKSLANLRPLLAKQISQEEDSAQDG
jgi:Ni,Fe-hydrogenase III component G